MKNKLALPRTAPPRTVTVGGGGGLNGSSIRTCATNAPKLSHHSCGKASISIHTWRARLRRESSWCRRRKRKRCIIRKLSGEVRQIEYGLSSASCQLAPRYRKAG